MLAVKKLIHENLDTLYSKQEIDSILNLILEKILGLSRLQIHLNQHETISWAKLAQIREIINRLSRFEPLQYILGETEFYGLTIKVTPAVLIPRPETEELVDWIIRDCTLTNPGILDIGTGSGCIPISLVKNIHGASAAGWDISEEALIIAKEKLETTTDKTYNIAREVGYSNINYFYTHFHTYFGVSPSDLRKIEKEN